MTLKNRLVRSATWEGMCTADGRPTDKLITCYGDLAKGGVRLIISGYTFVRPDGRQLPGKMGIHRDEFASEMRSLTKAVHDEGGKICIQLVHCGGQKELLSFLKSILLELSPQGNPVNTEDLCCNCPVAPDLL